jgi:hypothetical protein
MIFVFKTTVSTKSQVKQLGLHISKLLPGGKWNFDLEDCDRILRIDSEKNIALEIKALLNIHKFDCEEL